MAAEHPLLAEALASLDRAVIEASEAEEKLDAASDALSFDPARLDSIETRLFDLRGLARKHRVEPAQLGALYRAMTEKLTRMAAGAAVKIGRARCRDRVYQIDLSLVGVVS